MAINMHFKFSFSVIVKSALDYTSQATVDKSIQSSQETCNLFSPSLFTSRKTIKWTEKDLTIKVKELYKVLKSCKYADFVNNKTDNQVTNNTQNCSCVCESECSCEVSVVTLDLYDFCKDNEQLAGEDHMSTIVMCYCPCYSNSTNHR